MMMTDELEKYLDELFSSIEWRLRFEHRGVFLGFLDKELILIFTHQPSTVHFHPKISSKIIVAQKRGFCGIPTFEDVFFVERKMLTYFGIRCYPNIIMQGGTEEYFKLIEDSI